MSLKFNDQSEKPQFTYKRNPLVPHSFQVFEWKAEKDDYEPVGDYTLLDLDEDPELTEKKVMNLISLLNGRDSFIDLSEMTKETTLFQIVPKQDAGDPDKIIYRVYDGSGVSEENAILTMNKGVFRDG